MNYTAFFNNPSRHWTRIHAKPPEYRSNDGYVLTLEYNPRYSGYVWNLYKSQNNNPDDDLCIAHNVPNMHVEKVHNFD